jgi:predicted nucleic acid-binding protein
MTVLIDSWAWIEYWKGGDFAKQAAAYIEGDEESVVSTINLAEVYFWVSRYYDETIANEKLGTIEKRCHVISVEKDLAIEGAKIKRKNKLALADSLILATARQTGGRIVTGDPDMKGLKEVIFLSAR